MMNALPAKPMKKNPELIDWEKLKNARLIFITIEYDGVKVDASGRWAKLLECFVFSHNADVFYYYPDTGELHHCLDYYYIYKIQKIGSCRKIKNFKIHIKKVIQ